MNEDDGFKNTYPVGGQDITQFLYCRTLFPYTVAVKLEDSQLRIAYATFFCSFLNCIFKLFAFLHQDSDLFGLLESFVVLRVTAAVIVRV